MTKRISTLFFLLLAVSRIAFSQASHILYLTR